MSEGAQNTADDQEVIGEPVSQPHEAAVVGEPPEEITPVLGEPVPFANGAQKDQQPVSSPSLDDSATNGVHEDSSPASGLPPQTTDGPSSVAPSLESPSTSSAGERSSLEELSALSENPIPSEPTTDVSDVSTVDTHEAKPDEGIPADVEITHIADVATESPPPFESETASPENPYSVLDQDSPESVEASAKESSAPADRSLDDTHPTSKNDEASPVSESPVHDEKFADGLGETTVELPAMDTTSPAVMQEESEKDLATESQKEFRQSSKGIREPESDEPGQFSAADKQSDASTHDSNAVPSIEEAKVQEDNKVEESVPTSNMAEQSVSKEGDKSEEDSTGSGNVSIDPQQVVSEEGVLPEVGSIEDVSSETPEAPGKASSDVVEQVVSKKAASQREVFPNEKVTAKEDGGFASPDSSLASSDNAVSVKASSTPPSGTRDFPPEENQQSDETALGENGFQYAQDGAPLDSEQGITKGDSTIAKGEEKPTLRSKTPFIFTTVAIAIVGVVVATLSRSRQ